MISRLRSARRRLGRGALALVVPAALLLSVNGLAAPGGNGAATITGSFADTCRDFAAHSSKDISHVEIRYADGRAVKDERTTAPDFAIDGGPGDEIASVDVKSGTTTETFACTASQGPPVAVLEIEAPPDCVQYSPAEWDCGHTTKPRTTWLNPAFVFFLCDSGDTCDGAFRFRGTSSTDPNDDIVSWSIEMVDASTHAVIASASGTWPTPAVELTHTLPGGGIGRIRGGWYITLTVTDSANQSASDTISLLVDGAD